MAKIVVISDSGVRAVIKTSVPTKFSVAGALRGLPGAAGPTGMPGAIGFTGLTGPAGAAADGSTPINQAAHGLVVGDAIRYNGTAYVKSKADVPESAYVIGIVTAVASVNDFTYATSGAIPLSGLTAGSPYFLSDLIAGTLTAMPPTANATVVKPLVMATSTTIGSIKIERGSVNVVSRTYSRLGINFGVNGVAFNAAYAANHLQYVGRYTRNLRLSIPSWNDTTGISSMRQLVAVARDAGFKTSYGVTAAGTGHNLAYYNSWKAQVIIEAAWAAVNGVDTFYIGNEEDWFVEIGGFAGSGLTQNSVQNDVLAMATTLRASYPTMRLVYSTAQGCVAGWNTHNTGNLNALGFNMYDTVAAFSASLDYFLTLSFANKMFISEWGANGPYPSLGITAQQYRDDLAARLVKIRSTGIEAYFFTYDWGGSYGTSTDWGLYSGDGTYKPGLEQVFSIPR